MLEELSKSFKVAAYMREIKTQAKTQAVWLQNPTQPLSLAPSIFS